MNTNELFSLKAGNCCRNNPLTLLCYHNRFYLHRGCEHAPDRSRWVWSLDVERDKGKEAGDGDHPDETTRTQSRRRICRRRICIIALALLCAALYLYPCLPAAHCVCIALGLPVGGDDCVLCVEGAAYRGRWCAGGKYPQPACVKVHGKFWCIYFENSL